MKKKFICFAIKIKNLTNFIFKNKERKINGKNGPREDRVASRVSPCHVALRNCIYYSNGNNCVHHLLASRIRLHSAQVMGIVRSLWKPFRGIIRIHPTITFGSNDH